MLRYVQQLNTPGGKRALLLVVFLTGALLTIFDVASGTEVLLRSLAALLALL